MRKTVIDIHSAVDGCRTVSIPEWTIKIDGSSTADWKV
jgi:hypothetical protein